METKTISMPGNSKADLIKKLEELEQKHADTIKSNDVNFIKENGEWKRTNQFEDFENVKQAASNSNTAK